MLTTLEWEREKLRKTGETNDFEQKMGLVLETLALIFLVHFNASAYSRDVHWMPVFYKKLMLE